MDKGVKRQLCCWQRVKGTFGCELPVGHNGQCQSIGLATRRRCWPKDLTEKKALKVPEVKDEAEAANTAKAATYDILGDVVDRDALFEERNRVLTSAAAHATAPAVKKRTLLIGDSIIDNRAYAASSTGAILSEWGEYLDHAVEETRTADFHLANRDVPSEWYDRAAANGNPYAAKSVALYPTGPFDRVVISVGGNDVVMDPILIPFVIAGTLEEAISERVLKVLRKYRDEYQSATIFYVRPYNLTHAMVKALVEKHVDLTAKSMEATLALLNDTIEGVVKKILDAGFRVIDAEWRAEDVSVSPWGIPEPTTKGARRLAEAIHAAR